MWVYIMKGARGDRIMKRSMATLLISLICISQIAQVEAGWPRCNTGCTANDVSLVKLWQVSSTKCTPGTSTTTELWGTFAVNANGRYCPYTVVDIYINGILYEANHFTWLDTITGSTGDVKLATISYICGQSVDLRNIYAQWAASDQGTVCPTCKKPATVLPCDCDQAYQPAKCYQDSGPIIIPPPLIADFTASNTCLGNPIQFTDTTSGGYLPYQSQTWNFGDGTSNLKNPSHTYTTAGRKTVTLTVTDDKGLTSTSTHDVYVWAHPVADFTYNQLCGYKVHFTDHSTATATDGVTATITEWSWDFNDDTIRDSNLQNPEYTFSSTGTKTVTLKVADSHGCIHTVTKSVAVNPANQATASSNSPVCEGSTIQLTGGPIGMNSYSWIGPNGYTSNLQNPTISPATSANDDVYELTITDPNDCQSMATTSVTVQLKPTANAGPDQTTCKGSAVTLAGLADHYDTITWTGGAGTFMPDAHTLTATYTPTQAEINAASVTLTLSATALSPCPEATDQMIITMHGGPTAIAPGPQKICSIVPSLTLTGTAENFASLSWTIISGPGTVTQSDTNPKEATYYTAPDASAIYTETVVKFAATGILPCTGSVESFVTIRVDQKPSAYIEVIEP
jgi:PKD repeat protein